MYEARLRLPLLLPVLLPGLKMRLGCRRPALVYIHTLVYIHQSLSLSLSLSLHIYTHVICIYIYIYIERERGRYRYVYIYIYIYYVYIQRERESARERERGAVESLEQRSRRRSLASKNLRAETNNTTRTNFPAATRHERTTAQHTVAWHSSMRH